MEEKETKQVEAFCFEVSSIAAAPVGCTAAMLSAGKAEHVPVPVFLHCLVQTRYKDGSRSRVHDRVLPGLFHGDEAYPGPWFRTYLCLCFDDSDRAGVEVGAFEILQKRPPWGQVPAGELEAEIDKGPECCTEQPPKRASISCVAHLHRGDIVQAIRRLDPEGADVRPGVLGVVFEEAEYHEPDSGPMVRWANMGVCNIYDCDVQVVRHGGDLGVFEKYRIQPGDPVFAQQPVQTDAEATQEVLDEEALDEIMADEEAEEARAVAAEEELAAEAADDILAARQATATPPEEAD